MTVAHGIQDPIQMIEQAVGGVGRGPEGPPDPASTGAEPEAGDVRTGT